MCIIVFVEKLNAKWYSDIHAYVRILLNNSFKYHKLERLLICALPYCLAALNVARKSSCLLCSNHFNLSLYLVEMMMFYIWILNCIKLFVSNIWPKYENDSYNMA